MKGVIDSN